MTNVRAMRNFYGIGHAGLPLMLLATLGGCRIDAESGGDLPPPVLNPPTSPNPAPVVIASDFRSGADGWTAAFSDYDPRNDGNNIYQLGSGIERVPSGPTDRTGFFLNGANRSDDLFMYLYRPVTGLAPNTRYRVEANVGFATNAPQGCFGIGGSPGESVTMKVGATARAPAPEAGSIYPNFDKGNQSTGGRDVVAIGNYAYPDGSPSCDAVQSPPPYILKTLATGTASTPVVTSDAQGRLWLIVGTDSGYEGLTRIYWTGIRFALTPQS